MEAFGFSKKNDTEVNVVGEDDLDARILGLQNKLAEIQNNPNHPDIDLRAQLGAELTNLMESRDKGL